jgi:23S rRNA (uridine2552-2'-O)-methyltransferase
LKKSKNWITRQFNDPYTKLAKQKGYKSRSAFKLIEINNKFKFLKNNLNILDLGSAPGGWSQVCADINKNGKNLSIDILNMEIIDNIFFYKKDFNDSDFLDFINDFFKRNKVDIVLSDMAVNTTGNKDLDAIKTNAIALDVVNLSKLILKTKSALLVKIFSGKDENILIKNAKELFKKIERIKPDSSRKESREMYLLCRDLKII